MPSTREFLDHLPYLRRYSRAITGGQLAGDHYVTATLETIASDPKTYRKSKNPKIDLFRVFSQIWNSLAINNISEHSLDETLSDEKRLTKISPLPRQAFLLSCLEGFTEQEIAEILGKTPEKVRFLVNDAGRELSDEISTDILIIEDEALIAMDLALLVEELGHHVIGTAKTHAEAIKVAHQNRPGLILADIQLADGSSGLDAVNELLNEFEVPVIFITAYPERFLTGDRPEPAFLITKPFQPTTVSAVISQAQLFHQNAHR